MNQSEYNRQNEQEMWDAASRTASPTAALDVEYSKVIPGQYTTKRDGSPMGCMTCGTDLVAGQVYAAKKSGSGWDSYCARCAGSPQAQIGGLVARVEEIVTSLGDDVPAEILNWVERITPDIEQALAPGADKRAFMMAKAGLMGLRGGIGMVNTERREAVALDLTPVAAGHHTVGDGTVVKIDKPVAGKWAGWIFVKDSTGGRLGMQRPGEKYKGQAEDVLARILAGESSSLEPVPASGLDLTPMKAFTSRGIVRCAVPGGDTRLKLRIQFASNGTIYVNDCAEYGERVLYGSQREGESYRGKVSEALTAVLADPQAAIIRYTELVGKCGICNRPLEAADSVARGIGPWCAKKLGIA